jgi:hypothetical protein
MADERDTKVKQALQSAYIGEDIPNDPSEFREETAAEIAAPVTSESSMYRGEKAKKIDTSVPLHTSKYREENAAEIAAPLPVIRRRTHDEGKDRATGGTGIGSLAIALSILSLFVMPILFGAAGIVLGFVARRKGATKLGAWAIGLGAVSIVIGIFILPFF